MLFGDFPSENSGARRPSQHLASVSDRFFAFLIDLFFLIPIISLFLSNPLAEFVKSAYVMPTGTHLWLKAISIVLLALLLWVFTKALQVSVWGATLGQKVLLLEVRNHRTQERLTLLQALLREVLFCFELCALGIPLLEVLSHPERRPLHERGSESWTLSKKPFGSLPPHPVEMRFFKLIYILVLAVALSWVFGAASWLRQESNTWAHEAIHQSQEEESQGCIDFAGENHKSRVDYALSLFLTEQIDRSCLESEALRGFQGSEVEKSWASLATAFLRQGESLVKDEYLLQACRFDKDGEACSLGRAWFQSSDLLPGEYKSWSSQVLATLDAKDRKDVTLWSRALKNLDRDFAAVTWIQNQRVLLLKAQGEDQQSWGGFRVLAETRESGESAELAAQLCELELRNDCSVRGSSPCESLWQIVRGTPLPEVRPKWIMTLAEDKQCRKNAEPTWSSLMHFVPPKSPQGQYLMALLPDSGWSEKQRLAVFRKLSKPGMADPDTQSRSRMALLARQDDEKEIQLLKEDVLRTRLSRRGEFLKTWANRIESKTDRMPASLEKKDEL